jgi:hypothetical protein
MSEEIFSSFVSHSGLASAFQVFVWKIIKWSFRTFPKFFY